MDNVTRSSLSEIAADYPEVLALYLFGSHARGDFRADSDVDLAVLLKPQVSRDLAWTLRLKLADRVSGLLGETECDLIVLGDDLDLSFRVLREGERLYQRDPDEVCYREATIASLYYDFKPFLDSYLKKVAERFRKVR
jgi:predicted nucleotidyltransferase